MTRLPLYRSGLESVRDRSRPGAPRAALVLALAALLAPGASGAQELVRRFPPPPPARYPAAVAEPLPAALPEFAAGAPAAADPSWDALVGRIKPGRKVKVVLRDSSSVQGQLLGIDARSITVSQRSGPRVLPAGDVAQVQYATHRSRNAFLAGVAAWVAVGLVYNLVAKPSERDPDAPVFFGVLLGLPTGGIAAAVIHDRALYAAPAPTAIP